MDLMEGPRKQVYVRVRSDVYLYDGNNTQLSMKLPFETGRGQAGIPWTLMDKNGRIYGYSWSFHTGLFRFDPSSKTLERYIAKSFQVGIDLYRTAMDGDSNFWFKGRNKKTVVKYDLKGNLIVEIKSKPSARRKWSPVDIARNKEGKLVIADSANQRLVLFNNTGEYLGEFDLSPYSRNRVYRIRVDINGAYYVLFRGADHVIYRFVGRLFTNTLPVP